MPEAAGQLTDSVLAGALRLSGASPPLHSWTALLAEAEAHGVLPLLADAAVELRWNDEFIAAIKPHLAAEAALAMVREPELRRVLDALAADGITPLLLKGVHLAYTIYPAPDRRPRLDTDLLIAERHRHRTKRRLASLGYAPLPQVTGEVAFTQCQYARTDASGARHVLDLHWRIAVPKAFADVLTYEDLRRDARPLPSLGPAALVPAPVAALLLACVHRTAHHGASTRLVWLYDIHLLACALSQDEWETVLERSKSYRITPVVAAGLEQAHAHIGTPVPAFVLERLHDGDRETEPDVMSFLDGTPRQFDVAVADWRRTSGMRARLRFVQEHLFPPVSYMTHRYGTASRVALPFLYAHRAVTGAVKWLR